SVRPRRPVARRLRRRMASASSSVSSTRARPRGTPSQARSRPTARSSLGRRLPRRRDAATGLRIVDAVVVHATDDSYEFLLHLVDLPQRHGRFVERSEEHTSELQSHLNLVCRLLLEKKNKYDNT